MKELKYFYMNGCPYCRKVEKYMKDNNIDAEMIDIYGNPENKKDLIKFGGEEQVPMILVDGKPLYESDDIIKWFKENM